MSDTPTATDTLVDTAAEQYRHYSEPEGREQLRTQGLSDTDRLWLHCAFPPDPSVSGTTQDPHAWVARHPTMLIPLLGAYIYIRRVYPHEPLALRRDRVDAAAFFDGLEALQRGETETVEVTSSTVRESDIDDDQYEQETWPDIVVLTAWQGRYVPRELRPELSDEQVEALGIPAKMLLETDHSEDVTAMIGDDDEDPEDTATTSEELEEVVMVPDAGIEAMQAEDARLELILDADTLSGLAENAWHYEQGQAFKVFTPYCLRDALDAGLVSDNELREELAIEEENVASGYESFDISDLMEDGTMTYEEAQEYHAIKVRESQEYLAALRAEAERRVRLNAAVPDYRLPYTPEEDEVLDRVMRTEGDEYAQANAEWEAIIIERLKRLRTRAAAKRMMAEAIAMQQGQQGQQSGQE